MFSVVNGFTMDETAEGGDPPADQPPPDEAARIQSDYLGSLPSDHFPNVIAVAPHFAAGDQDARFELLLEIFVDGLARRADAGG